MSYDPGFTIFATGLADPATLIDLTVDSSGLVTIADSTIYNAMIYQVPA
jgi:hypothetical protein